MTVQKACPLVLSPQALATILTEEEGVKLSFHHGLFTRLTDGGAWELLLYPILLKLVVAHQHSRFDGVSIARQTLP